MSHKLNEYMNIISILNSRNDCGLSKLVFIIIIKIVIVPFSLFLTNYFEVLLLFCLTQSLAPSLLRKVYSTFS